MKYFNLNWLSRYREELFGLSIISIVLYHFSVDFYLAVQWGAINFHENFLKCFVIMGYEGYIGSLGVEIFVLLSGIGLYYSYHKDSSIKRFYGKRFKRILIPYFIVASIFWAIKDFYILNKDFKAFFADVSFYTFFANGAITIWFIALMILLYLFFPLIYKVIYSGQHRIVRFLLLMAAAYGIPMIVLNICPMDLSIKVQSINPLISYAANGKCSPSYSCL